MCVKVRISMYVLLNMIEVCYLAQFVSYLVSRQTADVVSEVPTATHLPLSLVVGVGSKVERDESLIMFPIVQRMYVHSTKPPFQQVISQRIAVHSIVCDLLAAPVRADKTGA